MGLKPSEQVTFHKYKNAIIVEKTPTIDDLSGIFYNPNIKPLSTKQMSKIIDESLFSDKYEKKSL